MTNILQRMRDLAVQSANGTNSNKNRDSLNKEFQSLTEQIGILARRLSLMIYPYLTVKTDQLH